MPRLRWTNERLRFTDHARDFTAEPGYEGEVPDDAVEEYLDHRSGDWERVEDDATESSSDEDETSESETGTDYEICGTEMSSGEICERPADECPYHGD